MSCQEAVVGGKSIGTPLSNHSSGVRNLWNLCWRCASIWEVSVHYLHPIGTCMYVYVYYIYIYLFVLFIYLLIYVYIYICVRRRMYMYICIYVCVCVSMYGIYMSAALFHPHLSKVCRGNKSRSKSHHSVLTQTAWSMPVVRTNKSLKLVEGGNAGKSCQAESTQQRLSPIFFDGGIRKQVQLACTKSWIPQTSTICWFCWPREFSRHTSAKTLWFDSVPHLIVTTSNLLLKILHANWSKHNSAAVLQKSRWTNTMKNSLFLQEDLFITIAKQVAQGPESARATQWSGHGFDAFKGSTRSWLSDSCCHLNFADPIDHHDRAHMVKK